MFSLLSGLWQYMFAKPQFQVLLLGLDNAGKTVSLSYPPNPPHHHETRSSHVDRVVSCGPSEMRRPCSNSASTPLLGAPNHPSR